MALKIEQTLGERKDQLLTYFRQRGQESLEMIRKELASSQFKKQASAINRAIGATKEALLTTIAQRARKENWGTESLLKCVLMTTYTSYIAMLEFRNEVWPYEYMTFSRRIGELWEPFCKLCFEYPIRDISLFIPPLFSEVKEKLTREIEETIDRLSITEAQKNELKRYYDKVWRLVTSGEIKLELDLHFEDSPNKINADFKSGFGSNEKGNTNRLLLVATIYKSLEENYKCVILVRSEEDENNHYFQTLKHSGVWEAYCGTDAYRKIQDYTGFDLKNWVTQHIDWKSDLHKDTMTYLRDNDLDQYLKW